VAWTSLVRCFSIYLFVLIDFCRPPISPRTVGAVIMDLAIDTRASMKAVVIDNNSTTSLDDIYGNHVLRTCPSSTLNFCKVIDPPPHSYLGNSFESGFFHSILYQCLYDCIPVCIGILIGLLLSNGPRICNGNKF